MTLGDVLRAFFSLLVVYCLSHPTYSIDRAQCGQTTVRINFERKYQESSRRYCVTLDIDFETINNTSRQSRLSISLFELCIESFRAELSQRPLRLGQLEEAKRFIFIFKKE